MLLRVNKIEKIDDLLSQRSSFCVWDREQSWIEWKKSGGD